MARASLAALLASAATAAFASFFASSAQARVVIATNAETVPLAVQIGTTVDTAPIVEWERVELRATTGALWFLVPVDPGDHVAMANEAFLGDVDRRTAPQLRRTLSPSCQEETAWGTSVDPGAPVLLGRTIGIDDDAALSAFFGAERVTVPAALLGALQGHLHRGGRIEALEARTGTASGNLVAAFRTERRTSGIALDWVLAGTTSVPVTSFLFAKTSAEAGVVHTLALGALAHRKSDLRADYLDLVATSLAAEAEDVALLEGSAPTTSPLTAIEADRAAIAAAFSGPLWVTRLAFAIPPKARGSFLVPRANSNDAFESSFTYEDAVCGGSGPRAPVPPPVTYGGEPTASQGTPVAEESTLEADDRTADAAAACTLIAIESCSSASSGGGDDDDSGSSDDSCSSDEKDGGDGKSDDDSSEADEPIDLGSKKGLELGHHRVVKKRSPVSRIAIGACAIVLPLRRRKRRE